MPAQPRQKQKLLVLRELLLQNTDENHKLLGTQIIDMLAARGISAERKTLYDDIETLCLSGMDILIDKVGHSNAYYVASRHFQDEELLVLADAVASSKFLTVKKSNELIKKIVWLSHCLLEELIQLTHYRKISSIILFCSSIFMQYYLC